MASSLRRLIGNFMSEFLGTLLLSMLVTGTMASLSPMLNSDSSSHSIFELALAIGLALPSAIFVSGGVSGGHVNPAVTLALALFGSCPWPHVPIYMLAQYSGAFVGKALVYFAFADQFEGIESNVVATIFAAYPPSTISMATLIYTELLATALLLLLVAAITDKDNMEVPVHLYPLTLGFALASIVLCLGKSGGGVINPATDFAGRLLALCIGESQTFFYGHYYFWVPLVVPHLGGAFGAMLYYVAIKPFLNNCQEKCQTSN